MSTNFIQEIILNQVNIPNFFQLIWVLGSMLLGYFSSKIFEIPLSNKLGKLKSHKWLNDIFPKLIGFLLFNICLFLGLGLSAYLFNGSFLILISLQFFFFIYVYFVLFKITRSIFLATIISLIGFVPWIFYKSGRFQELINLLNKFKIEIGSINITPITVFKALFLIITLVWIVSYILDWTHLKIKSIKKLKSNTSELLLKTIDVSVYFFTIVLGLKILGINLTALTVIGGALGVGIGFGLQKITSNFISGIILLLEKSIKTDDLIEMDSNIYGFVRKIGARYTLIETFEGKEIMVPNEDFITSRVTNWTFSNKKGRVEIPVSVSYHSDIEKAKQLIVEAALENKLSMKDPVPVCFLREFGNSSVNFLLFFFVEDVTLGRYQVQSEVMLAIWKKFKQNNIEIPFPQQDVYIKAFPNQENSKKK